MNQLICNILEWYQHRIGSHDKQSWEKCLDAYQFKNNLYCLSKNKSNKMNDLIDVDLVKGSTFQKTKTKLSLTNVLTNGVFRLALLPFYLRWWSTQTTKLFSLVLLVCYLLQVANIYVYSYHNDSVLVYKGKQLVSFVEIMLPSVIMLVLCIMYSYITSALPVNSNDIEKNQTLSKCIKKLEESEETTTIKKPPVYKSSKSMNFSVKTATGGAGVSQTVIESSGIRKRKLKINYSSPSLPSMKETDMLTPSTSVEEQVKKSSDMNNNQTQNDIDDIDFYDDEDQTTTTTASSTANSPLNGYAYSTPAKEDVQYRKSSKELNDPDVDYEVDDDDDEYAQSDDNSEEMIINTGPESEDMIRDDFKFSYLNNRQTTPAFYDVKEKISCLLWQKSEWKGVDLSMLGISNFIIKSAEQTPYTLDYFYLGIFFAIVISIIPVYYHNGERTALDLKLNETITDYFDYNQTGSLSDMLVQYVPFKKTLSDLFESVQFWSNLEFKALFVVVNTVMSTFFLCVLFFSLLTIAERTLSQRLVNAKLFCYLTSNRRAKKHNLPHFRLNRVDNIKTWLSVRSYIKRRGPQRSIDAIISSTFIIGVILCSAVCIRFLQDADFLSGSLFDWQLVIWCLCIWTYMLRFMTIGFKINKKYRNCMSTVITEQINLYLQMEKKPEKKDEITVVNNVLKLAADLLKEVENPFKISGLGVNPWVYNITKVVILSAASAVASELFGFKLKLYKIKIH